MINSEKGEGAQLMMNVPEERLVRIRYFVLFLMWLGLCICFPYTGDDWAWGSSIGTERLYSWFDNYSGRYLGNLIVLVLTRSVVLRSIVMAGVFTGIVYLTEQLFKQKSVFFIATLCILLTPRLVMRQAMVWTAGFANYSTSILLTLFFFVYVNEHVKTTPTQYRPGTLVGLLALGFANTLIVEHFTVFHVVISILIVAFFLVKERIMRWDFFTYCLGTVCGACWMFSNSVYRSISSNSDGYRTVAENGILQKAINNYFGIIYRESYGYNWFLNTILLVFCILLALRVLRKKNDKGALEKALLMTGLSIMILFWSGSVLYLLRYGYEYQYYAIGAGDYIGGCTTLLNLIATITVSVIVTKKETIDIRLVLLWGAALLLIGPLFAVTPIGSRCFFGTYIVLMLIACELIFVYSEGRSFGQFGKVMTAVCLIGILVLFVWHYFVFIQIHNVDRARLEYIRQGLRDGRESVELYHLPYEGYLWTATPFKENDVWEERYKLFYDIPESVDLIITKYDENIGG